MIRHTLREALVNLWRNRFMNLLASATIAVSLLLVGIFLLVAHNLSRVVASLEGQVTLSVYLKGGVRAPDREAILSALRDRPEVASIAYVSPQAALEKFRKLFPALREVPDALEENPFPASMEVAIAEGHRDPEAVRRFAEEIRGLPGVDETAFDLPWVSRLREVATLARAAGYSLGGVVGLAAVLTIASVIRLTIFSRQQEIEILRLVGATRTFILAPFLLESSLMGALGGGAALGALEEIHRYLLRHPERLVPLFNDLFTASFLPASSSWLLVILGFAAGALGGLLSLRRISI
jgi:cell division transport system permease protein